MKVAGQGLLTCDATAHDPTGKITLYGIFDRIWATQVPTGHTLFAIYWRCTYLRARFARPRTVSRG